MGFLDDVESIVINNKEVQSIIDSNGGIIYEKSSGGYELVLTGNKSIIQTGESVTLSATLTNNNVPMVGETIFFDGILTTPTRVTLQEAEYYLTTKYDVITIPEGGVLYLDSARSIHLTHPIGENYFSLVSLNHVIDTGTDFSMNNGILTYTDSNNHTKTADLTHDYDWSRIYPSIAECVIDEYSICYAVTDANGIATVSYTGKGTGDLNIKASWGIIQSEIYVLEDCLYWNDGSSTTGLVIGSNVSCTSNGDYITITTSTSGEKYVYLPVQLPLDFEYSFEIAEIGSVNDYAWIMNSQYYGAGAGGSQFAKLNDGAPTKSISVVKGDILKITHQNNALGVYFNDTHVNSKSVNVQGYDIGFYTNQNRIQHIKNIKLKAL